VGQKVSPLGLRIGINKDWQAKWYANKNDFAKYLKRDIDIRKYLDTKLKKASISNVIIERKEKRTEVIISTSKPGIIIGKGGEEITKLQNELKKLTDENVTVSIIEVKRPELDANLVAQDIARQIEGRVSFRIAQKRALRNSMKAGAKGIKTLVSGRLNGAEMARSEGYREGNVPLHTLRANIDYGTAEANTTYGIIGVKVWIYKGEILPSKKREGGKKNVNAEKNQVS